MKKTEHNLYVFEYNYINKEKIWKDALWVNTRSFTGNSGGDAVSGERKKREKRKE